MFFASSRRDILSLQHYAKFGILQRLPVLLAEALVGGYRRQRCAMCLAHARVDRDAGLRLRNR